SSGAVARMVASEPLAQKQWRFCPWRSSGTRPKRRTARSSSATTVMKVLSMVVRVNEKALGPRWSQGPTMLKVVSGVPGGIRRPDELPRRGHGVRVEHELDRADEGEE